MIEVYKNQIKIIIQRQQRENKKREREREIDAMPLMHSLTCSLDIQIPAEKVF